MHTILKIRANVCLIASIVPFRGSYMYKCVYTHKHVYIYIKLYNHIRGVKVDWIFLNSNPNYSAKVATKIVIKSWV